MGRRDAGREEEETLGWKGGAEERYEKRFEREGGQGREVRSDGRRKFGGGGGKCGKGVRRGKKGWGKGGEGGTGQRV